MCLPHFATLIARNWQLHFCMSPCIILPSRSSQLVQFIRSAIRNPLNPQSPPVIAICRKLVPWRRDWHKSSTRQVNSIRPRCGVAFVTIGPRSKAEAELMKLKQTRQDLEDFFGSYDVGPRLTRLLIPIVLLHRSRYHLVNKLVLDQGSLQSVGKVKKAGVGEIHMR